MMDAKANSLQLKEKGNEYYRNNDFSNAILCYSNAIKIYNDPVYYLNRSQAYFTTNNYLASFNDAITYLSLRNTINKSQISKSLYRIALCLQELTYEEMNNNLLKFDSIKLFLMFSLQIDNNTTSRNILYQLIYNKYDNIKGNNKKFTLGNFITKSLIYEPYTLWNHINTNENINSDYLTMDNPYNIHKDARNLLIIGFGKNLSKLFFNLNNLSNSTINDTIDIYMVDNSLNRICRTIILFDILYNSKFSCDDFFLSLYYDHFLSSKHAILLEQYFNNILDILNNSNDNITKVNNIYLHNDNSNNLSSCLTVIIYLWKTLLSQQMYDICYTNRKKILSNNTSNQLYNDEWIINGCIFSSDSCIPNPLFFDPISLNLLDNIGPFTNDNKNNNLLQIREQLSIFWNTINIKKTFNYHFVYDDCLSIVINQYKVQNMKFDYILSNNIIDKCGLLNILSLYSSILQKHGILETISYYGYPKSYKQLISPMNCNEDDVDKLLSCLGIECKDNIIHNSHIIITWKLLLYNNLNEEERTKLVVSHLTRFLMRYSLTPIIPHNYYKTKELFESNYQYPWYSTITYLLCAKQAGYIHKDSTKYIIDLALLNDQLGGRPFIKHRKLQMRILGSLLLNEIKDGFQSKELIIPTNQIIYKTLKVIPLKNDNIDIKIHKSLCLGLFSSKSKVDEAFQTQNTKPKSNFFVYIMSCDEKDLQIIDNIQYNYYARSITFPYPLSDFMSDTLKYGFIFDLFTYCAISKPFSI